MVSIIQTLIKVYENYGVAEYDALQNLGFVVIVALFIVTAKMVYGLVSSFVERRRL